MEINDELRELILVGASALELKKKAIEQGMITLRRSGLIKVALGQTTMEEVLRETVLQERCEMPGITLSELLKKMIEMGGSDLHVTTNSAPRVRVHGKLRPLDMPPLTASDTKSLAYSVLTDAQKHRFEENLELDFSFSLKNLARFRGNVFNQRGAVGSVFRTIPWEIKGFDALGLPPVVRGLCDNPRGLVLVTGTTGSRKSTTLAAMLDKINAEREEHMITIEDPIEFLHNHKKCLVNQREVHAD